MIPFHPHYPHAPGSPVQRRPDFQQYPFPVLPPLMIPEPQFLDLLRGQKLSPLLVASDLFGHPVLKPIQLDAQPCHRAVKVQEVFSDRMLSAELESRKPSGFESAPQLLFFLGLVTAETSSRRGRVHVATLSNLEGNEQASSPRPSPPSDGGEGETDPARQ